MATWYINADTGNDTTGDGSNALPWLTISKAHTSASAGDTIVCQDSTAEYTFTDQTFTKSNLTITGEQDDASGAVFNGGALVKRWTDNGSGSVSGVVIQKLTLRNITTSGPGTYRNIIAFSKYVFRNNVVKDIIQSAASGSTGASGIVGPYYAGAAMVLDIEIYNNVFYGLTGGSPTLMVTLLSGGGNDTGSFRFYNNTVYADGAYTTPNFFVFSTIASLGTVELKNNIFYATSSVAFVPSGTALNSYFDYNDTYNCTSVPSGTNNITSDPLFVDAPNDNFNLRPTSPCIDTGVLL